MKSHEIERLPEQGWESVWSPLFVLRDSSSSDGLLRAAQSDPSLVSSSAVRLE